MSEAASQFLTLAEKQATKAALTVAHRITGLTSLLCGEIVESRAHLDRSITFYDPGEQRPLALRFGVEQIQVSEGRGPPKQPLPPDWGAQVSLSLQVDEAAALNPGITFNQVLPNAIKAFGPANTVTTPQSFNLGFGATLSSTATRVDKFDPYWSIAFLMTPDTAGSACKKVNGEYVNDLFKQLGWTPASSSPFILESDLGIKEWLRGAMMVDYLLHSVGAPAAKGGQNPDTVSYEIKFVIVSNGSVTPTWKLVKVSANTSGTFFSTGRTRTHDLIIAIGPKGDNSIQAHLASTIGNAVANANRSVFTTPCLQAGVC